VSVGSIVGLFLLSMSVCRFHRWFVFVLENKNKPTMELTDTHRKQKQTNGGTDRHS
jgi:hypothetical protein